MTRTPTEEALENRVEQLRGQASEAERNLMRARRLNAVLTSIMDVHRFIIKEKNREVLVRGVCDILVKSRGYHNAWIALFGDRIRVYSGEKAGKTKNLEPLVRHMQNGQFTDCIKKVFLSPELVSVENTNATCRHCPVAGMHDGRGGMSTRLEHGGKLYGIITVSVPSKFTTNSGEQNLFMDVAGDIAHALHGIEAEEERKRADIRLRKARDELEHRVKMRTRELELLSSKLLSAQEEERKRIAADLHDGIGQSLSAIKFMLENTLDQPAGNTDTLDVGALAALVPMLQEASEEVRSIVMNLRPSILDDLGIITTIGWFCRQFRMIYTEIRLDDHIDIAETDIPDGLKIIIFRVLQEAMNNLAKYSRATRAILSLQKGARFIRLEIRDNGVGFDLEQLRSKSTTDKGFGITGMKERTELSGGVFDIATSPGNGCSVNAKWAYGKIRTIA